MAALDLRMANITQHKLDFLKPKDRGGSTLEIPSF